MRVPAEMFSLVADSGMVLFVSGAGNLIKTSYSGICKGNVVYTLSQVDDFALASEHAPRFYKQNTCSSSYSSW